MVRPDGQAEVEADRVIEKRRSGRQCLSTPHRKQNYGFILDLRHHW